MPPSTSLVSKLKVQLKLSISRLRMVQQKDIALAKQQRRALSQLVEQGKIESARIRVENIIRSDITTELHEILELYCELLIARSQLLDPPLTSATSNTTSQCDPGLEEPVRSLIYAAPRTEVKELHMARNILVEKFGKEFATSAMDGQGVAERVLKKLKIETPKPELVDAYLKEICRTYGVPFGNDSEEEDDESDGEGGGQRAKQEDEKELEPALESEPGSTQAQVSDKKGEEVDELKKAKTPKSLGPASPLRIAPPSPSTENVTPRIRMPGQTGKESGPPKKKEPSAKKKDDGPGGKIPDVDELAKRAPKRSNLNTLGTELLIRPCCASIYLLNRRTRAYEEALIAIMSTLTTMARALKRGRAPHSQCRASRKREHGSKSMTLGPVATGRQSFGYYLRQPARHGMATLGTTPEPVAAAPSGSDYGSDFDTDTEAQLESFVQDAVAGAVKPYVLESIEQDAGNQELHPAAHVPKSSSQEQRELDGEFQKYLEERQKRRETSVVIEYDEESRGTWSVAQNDHPLRSASLDPTPTPINPDDKRSPLERFRTKPKKPLSVTDLVSPSWCELQYWYTLTKYGKKRQTPAMKQGTVVHEALEKQVHDVVQVQVKTKEDMWGLKIWNVIQGLRTLRMTGLTRELEIWGVIDGEVVNGIIDELSYRAPLEAVEGEQDYESNSSTDKVFGEDSTEQKLTIQDFFRQQGATVLSGDPTAPTPYTGIEDGEPEKMLYITDVKTRRAKTLPQGSSLRPTKVQLMLYHRILTSLATNSVDPSILFARYNVNATIPFSDDFIAQIGSLDFNFRDDASVSASDSPPFYASESGDGITELLSHNSLTQLWELMTHEYSRAIPILDSSTTPPTPAISDLLKAEFRQAWGDGNVIGSKVFRYDAAELDAYLAREMAWWRGERAAVGVEIEEAFKCGVCEFAEGCEWRKGKVVEVVEKARLKKRGRPRKSQV